MVMVYVDLYSASSQKSLMRWKSRQWPKITVHGENHVQKNAMLVGGCIPLRPAHPPPYIRLSIVTQWGS